MNQIATIRRVSAALVARVRELNVKKPFLWLHQKAKQWYDNRRLRRRTLFIGGLIIIILLAFVLAYYIDRAESQRYQLQMNHNRLLEATDALQRLEMQKAESDLQIQQKAATEAELRLQIEKLQKDLQAKNQAPRTGGIGGSGTATRRVANTPGNTYTYGYCTWYVKNRRPSVPNGWGNAYEWLGNARAHGFATGSEPAVGAVGTRGNHVVYVEAVLPGGLVLVSEMNYEGWNIRSERTVPAGYFVYIY